MHTISNKILSMNISSAFGDVKSSPELFPPFLNQNLLNAINKTGRLLAPALAFKLQKI